jgi:hypothetical protein
MRRISITAIEETRSKLGLVKVVKEASGLGLKDSKDLCDKMHSRLGVPVEFQLDIGVSEKGFINSVQSLGGKYEISGGSQWIRNKKILELGIATEQDYSEFISDFIVDRIYQSDIGKSKQLLQEIFSKFDKNQLEGIFKNIIMYSE